MPKAPSESEAQDQRTSYFLGNDPTSWRANLPAFGRVRFDDVYPGIDVDYYGTDRNDIEYDLTVRPGADPSAVSFRVDGAAVSLGADGGLELKTQFGTIKQRPPVTYQNDGSTRVPIASRYTVRPESQGAIVGFEVGEFDSEKPLIIDPIIGFSSLGGGSDVDGFSNVDYRRPHQGPGSGSVRGIMERKIAVLGAGKAGRPSLPGILSSGWREPGEIVATARHQERLDGLAERHGVQMTLANAEAVEGAALVVIAVKPQDIEGLLTEIGSALTPSQTLLSIAAAIPTGLIERQLSDTSPSCAPCRTPR